MQLLFCYNPEMRKVPEPRYEPEVEVARELGFVCHLFGFEDFLDGKVDRAIQFLPPAKHQLLLYRGWMFKEGEYRLLDAVLRERGYQLFTSPDAYAEAHYLPNHYQKIGSLTAPAVWTSGTDLDEAWRAARSLGEGPWIVKDYVKSAKQRWLSACFIPPVADRDTFDEICSNFLQYQGSRFEKGFVFKKFIPLAQIGESAFEYPLCEEYRLFFWKHRLLGAAPYDRVGGQESGFSRFEEVAEKFQSEFITVDIAKTATGDWLILEVGDGGVSLLPPRLQVADFYQRLKERTGETQRGEAGLS